MKIVTIVSLFLGLNAFGAEDLARFSGNWATSEENCQKWKNDSFATTAEQSGKIMSIGPTTLIWSRGSCTVSEIVTTGNITKGTGVCEWRSREATGQFIIEPISNNKLVLKRLLSGYFSDEISTEFVKCNCKPLSADDYLGCH